MKSGATLVEIMVSIVILAVIAIAGAAYLAQANSVVAVQRNRMSAVATANRCMEEWRGTSWGTVTNLMPRPRTSATNYVKRIGLCSWSSGSGVITNNGVIMTVTNALNYVAADGASASFDCINVTVSVGTPGRPSSMVVMQTILGMH